MDWNQVFLEPVKMMLGKIASVVPLLIGFMLILLVGWLIASLLKRVLTRSLAFLKLDTLSGKIGFSKILEKAEIKYTSSEIIGDIIYWIVIFIALVTGVNALGLEVSNVLEDLIGYIPNIVIAIFILILGMTVSTFLSNLVVTACANAGISQGRILGKIVSVTIIVFSVMVALGQLKIAAPIINSIITIVFASFGIAIGLAFGLGGKDLAAKLLNEVHDSLRKK